MQCTTIALVSWRASNGGTRVATGEASCPGRSPTKNSAPTEGVPRPSLRWGGLDPPMGSGMPADGRLVHTGLARPLDDRSRGRIPRWTRLTWRDRPWTSRMPLSQHGQWRLAGIVNKGAGRPRHTPPRRRHWCSQPVACGWALAAGASLATCIESRIAIRRRRGLRCRWTQLQ